jgi:transposase
MRYNISLKIGVYIMSQSSKLLSKEVTEKAKSQLKEIGKSAIISRKLEAVISAGKHGITEVAKIYDITRKTLTSWIKHVKNDSMEKLSAPPERKRKNKLNDAHRKQILSWIEEDSQITIKAVRIRIEEEFEIVISKSTVHREIMKMGYSHITPRPKHFKQDPKKMEEFKKKY